MRTLIAALTLISLSFSQPVGADTERAAAIDGSQYAVIAPVFDGSGGGALSFIRLPNASTATATFNVTVVNANNGIVLGAASIQVPSKASPQIPLIGPDSIFSRAGVAASSNASYALYVQSTEALAGYQHVTFTSTSTLFENNSVCTTPLDQQLANSSKPKMLANVHSSNFATTYPSSVSLHNYTTASTTVTIKAYNADTGAVLGQTIRTIGANDTDSVSESDLEQLMSIANPSAHMNFEVSSSTGGTPTVRLTHTVRNVAVAGAVNMTEACAINVVPPTVVQVAQTGPVAYSGTSTGPTPYGTVTTSFVASVAPNGKVRANSFGQGYGYYFFGSSVGTLIGSTLILTSLIDGTTANANVQVQSGTIAGSGYGPYGLVTFSGSTAACSN